MLFARVEMESGLHAVNNGIPAQEDSYDAYQAYPDECFYGVILACVPFLDFPEHNPVF